MRAQSSGRPCGLFVTKNSGKFSLFAGAAAISLLCGSAGAFEIDTGNPNINLSWSNTVQYSAAFRVRDQNLGVAGDPATAQVNTNDGDLNFGRGLISNRFDLLSELDFRYGQIGGFRVSAAGWYDSVYFGHTDNPGNQGVNSLSTDYRNFTRDTRQLHGAKAELLDGFAYTNVELGDMSLNLKGGRYTQLYGESLFFGSNGIAAAQTPLDLVKALSVPNSQFKEIARPVGQIGGQLLVNSSLSVGAYYQLEWRKSRLPAAGSYFSFADFVDAGGETVLLGPGVFTRRSKDITARNNGQGGLQIKYRADDSEYGFYAARFHDKMPQFYIRPGINARGGSMGDHVQVYGENIRTVGASVSTLIGDTNVAGEISYRDNMPLVASGNAVVLPGNAVADGGRNARFPKGRTLHANVSAIGFIGANSIWDHASFIGEFAYNQRLAVTHNRDQLDAKATRHAGALQIVFQPEFFQVLPDLDIQVPIGISYGLFGRSSVNGALFPSQHGGNISLGVKADLAKTWQGSLNYTHYFGRGGSVVRPTGVPELSYANFHGDRDFVSVTLRRAF